MSPEPQASFSAPDSITDDQYISIEISNAGDSNPEYVLKIGGKTISGVSFDDVFLNFKLDQAFDPGYYDLEIFEVIDGEEHLIENLGGQTYIS